MWSRVVWGTEVIGLRDESWWLRNIRQNRIICLGVTVRRGQEKVRRGYTFQRYFVVLTLNLALNLLTPWVEKTSPWLEIYCRSILTHAQVSTHALPTPTLPCWIFFYPRSTFSAKRGHSDTSDMMLLATTLHTINSNKYKIRCTYIVLIAPPAILILYSLKWWDATSLIHIPT